MIKGLGVDIVRINRIAKIIDRWGDKFLQKVFTLVEIDYCQSRGRAVEHFAARFAAKEAALKMLSTGLRELSWQEIEVRNDSLGKPELLLHGRARELAKKKGIRIIHISISHEKEYALAEVIGE